LFISWQPALNSELMELRKRSGGTVVWGNLGTVGVQAACFFFP